MPRRRSAAFIAGITTGAAAVGIGWFLEHRNRASPTDSPIPIVPTSHFNDIFKFGNPGPVSDVLERDAYGDQFLT